MFQRSKTKKRNQLTKSVEVPKPTMNKRKAFHMANRSHQLEQQVLEEHELDFFNMEMQTKD